MTAFDERDIRADLDCAIAEAGLTWVEFIALGEADELIDISLDLDFAYRALVPSLGVVPVG